jgi:hypothetical protein
MCRGKARHRTAAHARIAMTKTGQQQGDLGLMFYRCRWCDFFHVGHASKREQKGLRYRRLLKLIEEANAPAIARAQIGGE